MGHKSIRNLGHEVLNVYTMRPKIANENVQDPG